MKFQIRTLVDITETGVRKGADPRKVDQQANYNTLYNTIGLRTNPTEFVVTSEVMDVKGLGFGSAYKGPQKVWTVEFFVEAEDSTSVDFMKNDFDLVPIITELDETAKLDKGLFITSSDPKKSNIIFERTDK